MLLERFRIPNSPLECYQLRTGAWKPRSVDVACSAHGYNQLLLPDGVDNAIEAKFSQVETYLPKTLKALGAAANERTTELPQKLYETMCLYCAFLKQVALYAKPAAVASFLMQLNMELKDAHYCLFHELGVPIDAVAKFREGYAQGGRLTVESTNVLQLIYRLQWQRLLQTSYWELYKCEWTISHSPVELPLSDVGLVPMHLPGFNANQYFLPIGPRLLLEGLFYFDPTKNPTSQAVHGHQLTAEEAEYRLEAICASAVTEIICSRRRSEIKECRDRAKSKGITFNRIMNVDEAIAAGSKSATTSYSLRMVPEKEYIAFIHSIIQPPTLPPER